MINNLKYKYGKKPPQKDYLSMNKDQKGDFALQDYTAGTAGRCVLKQPAVLNALQSKILILFVLNVHRQATLPA
ncbi:MAG: hypothetical protein K8R67_07210 [Desulfobacteraceae bacterium]|nr:hypothetical protein [Desulfobacteraceae bacterium]